MNVKTYVLSFVFTPDFRRVWLITKNRPQWQAGCLNGIGGKIEDSDFSNQEAAERELKEEAGVYVENLKQVGYMDGTNNDDSAFQVIVFAGSTDEFLRSETDEQISLVRLDQLRGRKMIENLPALIELSKYHLTGNSNFDWFHLKY